MKRLGIALGLLVLATPMHNAFGQTLNARRMAMGGVVLPGNGSEAANVAYRAVPPAPGSSVGLPLPIGLIPVLANPPALDPKDPDFNIYELANTVYNPPWNLQLISPTPPSNDIVVELGKNHLSVDLGDVGSLFPDDHSKIGAVTRGPTFGWGVRNFFLGASAVVDYKNDLSLSPSLRGVLANGEEFQTNTEYSLYDQARGQAAAMLELGWAAPIAKTGDPRTRSGTAIYVGARSRLTRGLAYGDAQNAVGFSTGDSLFSSAPIDLDYIGYVRQTGPQGGGWGHGLDLGLVWLAGDLEAGVGINDVASRLDWRVEESIVQRDSVTGEFTRTILADRVPFSSQIPRTGTLNVATKAGRFLVAADVVRSAASTTGHVGLETWLGLVGLRTGAGLDNDHRVQFAGGLGIKIARFGVDLAVASNSRNLTRERGLELGAGLALYR